MFRKIISIIIFGLISGLTVTPSPTQVPDYNDVNNQMIDDETNIETNTLSTALVTIASIIDANQQNLTLDLYPTLHSALMIPFTLISNTMGSVLKFYDQRSIFDILSFSSLKSAIMMAPKSVYNYWSKLIEMEMECMFRTICDLSAYLSIRLPNWMKQILGIYFTSNNANNMYFRAVANGMINNNCINYYPKCSTKGFFARLATNATEILTTTLSPLTKQMLNAINVS